MCFTVNYLLVWKFDFNHFKNSDYTIPFKNYFIVKECFDLVKLNLPRTKKIKVVFNKKGPSNIKHRVKLF